MKEIFISHSKKYIQDWKSQRLACGYEETDLVGFLFSDKNLFKKYNHYVGICLNTYDLENAYVKTSESIWYTQELDADLRKFLKSYL